MYYNLYIYIYLREVAPRGVTFTCYANPTFVRRIRILILNDLIFKICTRYIQWRDREWVGWVRWCTFDINRTRYINRRKYPCTFALKTSEICNCVIVLIAINECHTRIPLLTRCINATAHGNNPNGYFLSFTYSKRFTVNDGSNLQINAQKQFVMSLVAMSG